MQSIITAVTKNLKPAKNPDDDAAWAMRFSAFTLLALSVLSLSCGLYLMLVNPPEAQALLLARAARSAKTTEAAQDLYLQALALDPQDPNLWLGYALLPGADGTARHVAVHLKK